MGRPTRREMARRDWRGWQDRRESIVIGVAVCVLTLLALYLLGRGAQVLLDIAIAGVTGAVVAVLYPIGQVAWAWFKAPMRLLTEDVIAIREHLEAAPLTAPARPFDLRYAVLNAIRLGESLANSGPMTEVAYERWVNPVITMLTVHVSPNDAESFLKAKTLSEQLVALRTILDKNPRTERR